VKTKRRKEKQKEEEKANHPGRSQRAVKKN